MGSAVVALAMVVAAAGPAAFTPGSPGPVHVSFGSAAYADDEPVTETPPEGTDEAAPFGDGDWVGTMSARGGAGAQIDGVDGRLSLDMSGPVTFTVSGGSVVDGEGEMSGSSIIDVTADGLEARIVMLNHAWGDVTGSTDQLTFDGRHTTDGTVVVTSPYAGTQSFGSNEDPFGPYDAEVVGFDCNRVLADFSPELEAAAIDGGWQTVDLEGRMEIDRMGPVIDGGEDLRDQAEQLLEDYNDWADEVRDGVHADAEDPTTVLTDGLRGDLNDLVNRAVDLEFDLRGADADDLCAFGTDLGGFSYLFTAMVQNLAIFILESHAGLRGEDLRTLADILTSMGGIGAGAARADDADALADLLTTRGGEVLDRHVVTDDAQTSTSGEPCSDAAPCLAPDNEVIDVLFVGSQQGLTFEVAGAEVAPGDAGDVLAALGE